MSSLSKYIGACIPFLMLLTAIYLSPIKPQRLEVSNEEYAVYSAYLNSVDQNYNDGRPVKLVVVLNKTTQISDSCTTARHSSSSSRQRLLFAWTIAR